MGSQAADSSDVANSGVYVNKPLLDQRGAFRYSRAVVFNWDQRQYAQIPHNSAYETDEGTILFWFRADHTEGIQGLFSKDYNGREAASHISIFLNERELAVRLESLAANQLLLTVDGINDREWYSVGVNFGANGAKLYLNGNM